MSKIDKLKEKYRINMETQPDSITLIYEKFHADLEELRPYEFTKADLISFADYCDSGGEYFTLDYKFELWQQIRSKQ